MTNNRLSLVKYAGEYWVSLAEFTSTRDASKYSDAASLKSAVRTYIVKLDSEKYIAFRGEQSLKSLVKENANNSLFYEDNFRGTRTALIHWSLVDTLNNRFPVDSSYSKTFRNFVAAAEDIIVDDKTSNNSASELLDTNTSDVDGRSSMVHQLRRSIAKEEKEISRRMANVEKMKEALKALEGLNFDDL